MQQIYSVMKQGFYGDILSLLNQRDKRLYVLQATFASKRMSTPLKQALEALREEGLRLRNEIKKKRSINDALCKKCKEFMHNGIGAVEALTCEFPKENCHLAGIIMHFTLENAVFNGFLGGDINPDDFKD